MMSSKAQENPEISIYERISELINTLSADQLRFIAIRPDYKTDKEAAEAISLKPDTVYHWPSMVKEAIRLLSLDRVATAQNLRRRHLIKAMMVKVRGLDSDNERIRQGVATEIVEGELGQAPQSIEHHFNLKDWKEKRAQRMREIEGLECAGED